MKTIEQEIRERLAAEQLSPENVDACMEFVKADPSLHSMLPFWARRYESYAPEAQEMFWLTAWESVGEWIEQQQLAALKEGE